MLFFDKDSFGIKQATKVDMPLKIKKPNQTSSFSSFLFTSTVSVFSCFPLLQFFHTDDPLQTHQSQLPNSLNWRHHQKQLIPIRKSVDKMANSFIFSDIFVFFFFLWMAPLDLGQQNSFLFTTPTLLPLLYKHSLHCLRVQSILLYVSVWVHVFVSVCVYVCIHVDVQGSAEKFID